MYILYLFIAIFTTVVLIKDTVAWVDGEDSGPIKYIFMDCTLLTWAIVRLRLDLLGG